MKGRTLRWIAVGAAALLLALGATLLWLAFAPRRVPAGQPELATLDSGSLPALREAFNACDGEVRLLALLSPT